MLYYSLIYPLISYGFVVSGINVFWNVTLCTVFNRYKCFRGTCCLSIFRVEAEAKHGKKEKRGTDTGNGKVRAMNKPISQVKGSQEQKQRILTFKGLFSKDQINGEIIVL
jgi:hypothetical protein